MAELKTKKTKASVEAFLQKVDSARRDDCVTLVKLMKHATKAEPKMWGSSIVGFGDYKYKYDTGREGEWFQMGFSPRKNDFTLYILPSVTQYQDHLAKLGPHKTGVSCLYIKRLADVNVDVLRSLMKDAAAHLKARAQ